LQNVRFVNLASAMLVVVFFSARLLQLDRFSSVTVDARSRYPRRINWKIRYINLKKFYCSDSFNNCYDFWREWIRISNRSIPPLSALTQDAFHPKVIRWNGMFGITLLLGSQIAIRENFATGSLKPLATRYFWWQPNLSKRTRRSLSTTKWNACEPLLHDTDKRMAPRKLWNWFDRNFRIFILKSCMIASGMSLMNDLGFWLGLSSCSFMLQLSALVFLIRKLRNGFVVY